MLGKASPPPFVPSLKSYLLIRINQCPVKPAEIARRAGISPALLYRFLNEQRDLSLSTIDKILPVIEGEIGKLIDAFLSHHEEMVRKEQAMFEAIAIFASQEGAIESAILGLREAMDTLMAIREASGSDFREAIGYGLPETPESLDEELRALMESEEANPAVTPESIDEEIRALMESDDEKSVDTPEIDEELRALMDSEDVNLPARPELGEEDLTEMREPGNEELSEVDELGEEELPEMD